MSLLKLFINSNKKCLLNASSSLVSKISYTTRIQNQSKDDKNIKLVNDITDNKSIISTKSNNGSINHKESSKATYNSSSSNCSSKYQKFIEKNKSSMDEDLMQFRNELLLAEVKEVSHEYTDNYGKLITAKLDYIDLKNSTWPTIQTSTLFIRSFFNKYFTERLNSFKFSYFPKTDLRDCFLLLGTQGICILYIFLQLYSSEICLW